MKDRLISVGITKAAVIEARKSILAILATKAEPVTIRVALKAFAQAIKVDHTVFSNNYFTGE